VELVSGAGVMLNVSVVHQTLDQNVINGALYQIGRDGDKFFPMKNAKRLTALLDAFMSAFIPVYHSVVETDPTVLGFSIPDKEGQKQRHTWDVEEDQYGSSTEMGLSEFIQGFNTTRLKTKNSGVMMSKFGFYRKYAGGAALFDFDQDE